EDRGGPDARQGDAAGRHQAKALRPGRKRALVDALRAEWAISIRRACAAIRFDPKTYRYKSRRPGQTALEQRIKEICQTRVRFGYRRVHVLLRREGWAINRKKTYRLTRGCAKSAGTWYIQPAISTRLPSLAEVTSASMRRCTFRPSRPVTTGWPPSRMASRKSRSAAACQWCGNAIGSAPPPVPEGSPNRSVRPS